VRDILAPAVAVVVAVACCLVVPVLLVGGMAVLGGVLGQSVVLSVVGAALVVAVGIGATIRLRRRRRVLERGGSGW
jgi:hypothetical protein